MPNDNEFKAVKIVALALIAVGGGLGGGVLSRNDPFYGSQGEAMSREIGALREKVKELESGYKADHEMGIHPVAAAQIDQLRNDMIRVDEETKRQIERLENGFNDYKKFHDETYPPRWLIRDVERNEQAIKDHAWQMHKPRYDDMEQ